MLAPNQRLNKFVKAEFEELYIISTVYTCAFINEWKKKLRILRYYSITKIVLQPFEGIFLTEVWILSKKYTFFFFLIFVLNGISHFNTRQNHQDFSTINYISFNRDSVKIECNTCNSNGMQLHIHKCAKV